MWAVARTKVLGGTCGGTMESVLGYTKLPSVFSFSMPKLELGGVSIRRSMATMAAHEATGSFVSETRPRRVFADHVFYKGKCALNMRLIKPTFKISDSGDAILSREGTVMLEFAPSISQRQYDWGKKQLFALSVSELGQILALTPSESLEFFHDPNMGKSDAGMVRKSLKIEPTTDRNGFFFGLTVANKVEKAEARLNIPISKGEFAIIRSAANYALPYLMGWHYATEVNGIDEAGASGASVSGTTAPRSLVQPPSDIDPEWDK
ncbi:single-stranded DNA-binding protein WHY2, mitochondrial isoform X1 [Selaginella moellendorffii]|uniref:single-stranded DNA-binding protein WHY2, mitochondrial isoform X1 n=1 Tax=Selaginella moellendorffii TaxID=88036 RepID=UPI000D1CB366|nr:single-stranded DNA-binding protein WHY2, mitochondrial isoform X1 [Selaginella moellendorffii]XP_024525980.1 single-stranded DNA-binding protein WHY2, mitochondrial isoform X1 [Selaginella moellendorffii]|eukprot:XP_024525979.1 single-stranded DNA-binding protein WHY2, mitochondrial isoform X1 [Selaginella moellendorffii]